ncbi:MAG: PIG-L family deacetylase [Acidimicrobiales bacterium]|nr:PIG-L family deacetylase [Acidimicrobiales bacterium]
MADIEISRNLPIPKSALAIGAHPDDIEFNVGGTFAKWSEGRTRLAHVICTDGSKGTWDKSADSSELISARANEAKRAALMLGASEVMFLGQIDGELEETKDGLGQIVKWIREFKPQVVVAHDPWKRYRLHPDHRKAGFLALNAVVGARDPLFFPELNLEPYRPEKIMLYEADLVDHVEEIGDWLDTKVQSLLEHKSQLKSTMDITDANDQEQVLRFKNWVTSVAQNEAYKYLGDKFSFVESFKIMDL